MNLSRRDFLKLAGITTLAIAGGGSGLLLRPRYKHSYTVIPDIPRLLCEMVVGLKRLLG